MQEKHGIERRPNAEDRAWLWCMELTHLFTWLSHPILMLKADNEPMVLDVFVGCEKHTLDLSDPHFYARLKEVLPT